MTENKFLAQLLALKKNNQDLQEQIWTIKKQQEENNKLFSDTVFEYVKKNFPEKLDGMIEPERENDKQFWAWDAKVCKFKDSYRENVDHDGIICFEVLCGYDKDGWDDPLDWEPIRYERCIYVEDLPKED